MKSNKNQVKDNPCHRFHIYEKDHVSEWAKCPDVIGTGSVILPNNDQFYF